MKNRAFPILFAFLAAAFYALNIPLSNLLMEKVPPTFLAGLLYLGAGGGVGILFLFRLRKTPKEEFLDKHDALPTTGMIVLDIAAPILLMFGLKYSTPSNASLLGNFEIVATSLLALLLFKERISPRLWVAIGLVSLSSAMLTFDLSSFSFSWGSLLVLGATLCWGLENNCTRRLSIKSPYQITMIKGLACGSSSILIALLLGQRLSDWLYPVLTLLLGFAAIGLSVLFYIKAQKGLGAAKTSAIYAVNPFLGAILSMALFWNIPSWSFCLALGVMVLGVALVVVDVLKRNHSHFHKHYVAHTHDGSTHTHVIVHEHDHVHVLSEGVHHHTHKDIDPHDRSYSQEE